MTVKVKEWTQREWTHPGVEFYRDRGDFSELNGLILGPDGKILRRAPAWSSYTAVTFSPVAQPGEFYAAFTDVSTHPVVFIVQNGSNLESAYYISGPYYAHTVLTSAVNDVGGRDGQNVLWWGGYLYLIGSDKKIYRGASYKSAISAFYSTTDALLLVPWDDRVYLITESGEVLRVNDADTAFESFCNPLHDLNVLFATPFRHYLLLASLDTDGTLTFYQLSQSGTLSTLTEAANIPYTRASYGHPFAHHDDRIYFIPGGYYQLDNGNYAVDVYSFDGTRIAFIDQVEWGTTTPVTISLLSWFRNQLALCCLYASVGIADATHGFRILTGNRFTALPNAADGAINITPRAFSLTGQILLTADSDDGQGATDTGFLTLGTGSIQASGGLQDGYLVTSRLDMGHPGKPKRLDTITVLLDDAATDFKVLIKYRIDDNTSWTTATTGNNTRRVSISALGLEFYTLQLRVEIDDDTGSDHDYRIHAVSVMYTVNE